MGGGSLYNRIHLGRRYALLSLRRVKAAAGFVTMGLAFVIWMVTTQ